MSDSDTTSSQQLPIVAANQGARAVPTLVVIAGASLGRAFRIDREIIIIGRAADADVRLDDEGVSRQHVRITARDGSYRMLDLGSTNGTMVNGLTVDEAVLKDGDKLQIGASTILKFQLQDELEEQMQRRLFESASRDSLTGIYNKRTFLEMLEKDVAFSRRHGVPLAVLMMDLDHFKKINDTHGHLAGDEVLCKVAAALQEQTRAEDLLARYGGEEFAALLRRCPHEEALKAGERMRAAVEGLSVEVNGQPIPVRISVGVATLVPDGNAETLVGAADEQLYRAKSAGRNLVRG